MNGEAPDPFGPLALEMGAGAILGIFRALRRNGATWVEATCIACGQVVLNAILADDGRQDQQ